MTDKELLELAAKAAGIDFEFCRPELGGCLTKEKWWNPLTDDGDALRLAVKLVMSVEISEPEDSTYAYSGEVPRDSSCEMWLDDKGAATRRAIVRAAAETGKASSNAEITGG